MRMLRFQGFALVAAVAWLISAPAYGDGFDMKMIASLTEGKGSSKSDVEKLLGSPFETVEIARSENGCVEGWFYSEVIMDGLTVKATQVLTVFFDENGHVCSTYITDGDKLDEERNRE